MNMRLFLVYISCLFSLHAIQRQGVVLKPCIDLVGQPLTPSGLTYEQLPHAGGSKRPFDACPRMHQLLYNETVEILKEHQDELYIRAPQAFYITTQSKTPRSSFWTHKDNIIPINALHTKAQRSIPTSIDYTKHHQGSTNTVALSRPWHSKVCGCTFSVGTRFTCKPIKKGAKKIIAYAIAPHTKQLVTMTIPKSHCVIHGQTEKSCMHNQYVQLLKEWAQIPTAYVWGGSSLLSSTSLDNYQEKAVALSGQKATAYEYTGTAGQHKTGFDCSGLILRAAQTAGMPYYFRNTTTLATYLKPVQQLTDLKDGDLIWIPWHVMAIGDIAANTIIEARHYSHGYGKLHEIKLHKMFKGIHTFADLFHAIAQNKPLYRLNKEGTVVGTIRKAKILAIDSCWNRSYS